MKVENAIIDSETIVPSDNQYEGMCIRQSGIAKVHFYNLTKDIPESEIIPNGVNRYKD